MEIAGIVLVVVDRVGRKRKTSITRDSTEIANLKPVVVEALKQLENNRKTDYSKAQMHILLPGVNEKGAKDEKFMREFTERIREWSRHRFNIQCICASSKSATNKTIISQVNRGEIDVIVSCHVLGRSVDCEGICVTLNLRSFSCAEYMQIAIDRGTRIIRNPLAPPPETQRHLVLEYVGNSSNDRP